MSEINANIVITPIDLGVTVNTNQLTFTPDATSLNFYTGGISTTANGLNANVANVHIYDGVNGYVLQTDGAGNLSWTAQTGNGGGNGTPGGANTQVQYNNAGLFGGTAGFTFNSTTGNLNVPNNIIATTVIGNVSNANFSTYSGIASSANLVAGANVTGTVANATYANISGVAYSVAGANVSGAVAFATTANSVAGANVSGSVANATYANISGVAYSVAGANVSGAVAYATTANAVAGANVSGQVANALISGTVYTNAQPNITSVGTLTSLSVTGTTSIQQAIEKMTTVGTGATGTITYNLLNQSILFYTANASGNFSLNYVGNGSTSLNSVMNSNQSMTSTFINTNGLTGYYLTDIQIDGYSRTVNWVAPTAPNSGTIFGKDVYTFNLLKTASNTYTILGSRVGYL